MIRGIVNTPLHTFWSLFNSLRMINRPVATKKLTINCEFQHFGVHIFYFGKHLRQTVVESGHQIMCIIEALIEILSRIIAWYRDITAQKISPSPISYCLPIEMDGKV